MQDKLTDNKADDDSQVSAGARLRAARETAGISVDEVADKLHLDRSVVIALEEDDHAVLGAPVFVKGHLRSYARLLGLSEGELADGYQLVEPEAEEFKTLSTQTVVKAGANLSSFFLWVLLAVIILIGAIYLLLGDDEEPSSDFVTPAPVVEADIAIDNPADSMADEQDLVQNPEQLDVQVAEPEPDVPEARSDATVAVLEPPVLQPVVELPEAVPAEQLIVLTLRFTAECWVEVSDSQRRLLYGLEKAGSERVLKGRPPFRLFLGNTDAVELQVAEQEYIVPRAVRTGSNTARFVIDDKVIAEILQ